jgi:phage/plasmid-associated DNA primase
MIQVLKDGKGFHKLQPPAKVMEYTSEYRNDNDGIAKFISERLEVFESGDEVFSVSKETLRSVFKQWKIQNEQLTLTPSDLEKRITEQFGKYPKGGWTNFRVSA